MSDLQQDIERMERLVEAVGDEYDEAAVQRIRARLTPDRERMAEAVQRAAREVASPLSDFAARHVADAAIKAMEGEP